jgi:hypothetical protein
MPKIEKQSKTRKRVTRQTVKKPTGLLGRIEPVNTDTSFINVNIYGRSGTGKTTLWSSFPKPLLVLLSSKDDRDELRSLSRKDRKDVSVLCLEESNEVLEIVDHVNKLQKYRTVVMDHITDLQLLILKEILSIEELPTQLSWGLATQQQYGQCTLKTKEAINALIKCQCNTVIVAQEREFNVETEHEELLSPFICSSLTPSAVGYLNSKCSYIVQTFIREEVILKKVGKKTLEKKTGKPEYCLRTGPHESFITKFRVPKDYPKPDVLVDPSYDKIMNIVNGKS